MNLRKLGKNILYALQRLLPRRHGTLVLAYHSVDFFNDPYTVSPEMFKWQMEEIQRQRLRVIRLSELEAMLKAGKVEDRTVLLTFDDGREDNYTHLLPIIREYKFPITIFSLTGVIGGTRESSVRPNRMLTEAQMHEMRSSGLVDFQPHTETHPKLTQISMEEVRREVSNSKNTLEGMFSEECPYFVYPYGRNSPEIKKILSECGIRMAFTGIRGFVTETSDRLLLPRSEIMHSTTKSEFRSILNRGSLR